MLELLEKNPEAAAVIRSYYLNRMLASLSDENLPEGFKDFVRAQDIDNEKIAKMLEHSPRSLFDVFDLHDLYVEILYMEKEFHYTVQNGEHTVTVNETNYKNRVDCERAAVEKVMKLLNAQLCEQTKS
jgi:hypothetical protein